MIYRSAPYLERCRVCRAVAKVACERCSAPLCPTCECHPPAAITPETGKIFALLYSTSLVALLICGLAISERLLFLIPAANLGSLMVATAWGRNQAGEPAPSGSAHVGRGAPRGAGRPGSGNVR